MAGYTPESTANPEQCWLRYGYGRCASWGLYRMHVKSGHNAACPEIYAFSASMVARCSACKINDFCARCALPHPSPREGKCALPDQSLLC